MSYFYSASNNAFYAGDLQESYEASNNWPDDLKPVNSAVFSEFTKDNPGKVRVAGKDGLPSWADIPPPTKEEQIAVAEENKQLLIDQANGYMNSKQWPGKAAMGRLSDADKVKYNAWLDYLDALEATDTSSAPDIDWPTPPAV